MATSSETMEFLLDQLYDHPGISSRKMFGEYCLYLDGKPVALICDDDLFVKPTGEGAEFIGEPDLAPPFPGAKDWLRVTADKWEDREWLTELLELTAEVLPAPKPKKKRKPKS